MYEVTYAKRDFIENNEIKETHMVSSFKRALELVEILYGIEKRNFRFNDKMDCYCAGNYLGSVAETVFIEEV